VLLLVEKIDFQRQNSAIIRSREERKRSHRGNMTGDGGYVSAGAEYV
jgi:hypothetical protein